MKRGNEMRWTTVLATLSSLAIALLGAAPATAAYPGENGKIYFTARAVENGLAGGVPDVWSVNPDGSELVNLTDLPGGPGEGYGPSAAGTGSAIAFGTGSQATAEIWTMNADGSSPQQVTDDGLLDQQPAVSPDGSRIVFSSFRPTYVIRDIWSMGFDGSGAAALVNSTLQDFSPAFTPDGETIVLSHETGGTNFDIASAPSSGGPFATLTQITTAATEEVSPSVSPDGKRVAFARWPDGFPIGSKPDVVSANLTGGAEQPIAADPGTHESLPSYSPDGTKIVYVTDAGNGTLVIADRTAPTRGRSRSMRTSPQTRPTPTGPSRRRRRADTTAPETTITKKPKKRSSKRKAKVRFESSESDSSFECKLDRKAFKPCDSPRKLKRLKPRKHRFAVRAIDAAGNVDPTPAKARFRVLEKK